MIIDNKKIEELAQLARLEFDDDEKSRIKGELERILEFCNKLNELDTQGVKPLIYVNDANNVLREDKIQAPMSKSDAFENAPAHDSDYFKVPKVIVKK